LKKKKKKKWILDGLFSAMAASAAMALKTSITTRTLEPEM
jgi:hypothetical protein